MNPKKCLRKVGVEEKSPSQGEISWLQRDRWTMSPQQHEEAASEGLLSLELESQRKTLSKLQAQGQGWDSPGNTWEPQKWDPNSEHPEQ